MKTKIAIGLVMTLALGALVAAPASAEPGKGKGTGVVRGNHTVEDDPCESAVDGILLSDANGLDAVKAVSAYNWRWVYKSNGRPSKLFCRIKGAEIDDQSVDPPDRPNGNIVRLRGEDALRASVCPTDPDGKGSAGQLLRARFKMNAKGNGHLKCVYEPPSA